MPPFGNHYHVAARTLSCRPLLLQVMHNFLPSAVKFHYQVGWARKDAGGAFTGI
jgi:hypothetical protein